MSAVWASLDDAQRSFIACGLTCLAGLFLAAWHVQRQVRRDLDARARRDAAAEADAADDAEVAWSAAAWAEFDLIGRGRS